MNLSDKGMEIMQRWQQHRFVMLDNICLVTSHGRVFQERGCPSCRYLYYIPLGDVEEGCPCQEKKETRQ